MTQLAIVLTGHMRTFHSTSLSWNNLRKKYNADLYISTWNYRGPWTLSSESSSESPGTVIHDSNDVVTIDSVLEQFPHSFIEIHDYNDFSNMFTNRVKPCNEWRDSLDGTYHRYRTHSYYSTYFKRFKGFELVKNHQRHYNAVVLSRPDLSIEMLDDTLFNDMSPVYTLNNPTPENPWWVNDILLLTNYQNAESISNCYNLFFDKFESAKRDNRPETFFEPHGLLKHHMVTNNMTVVEPGPDKFFGQLIR